MTAVFITFEGLDGSGKTSHLKALSQHLARHGTPFCLTHEPGGSPLGEGIRALFLDPSRRAMDGVVELLLVFASRRQHLLEVIEPALARGEIVLCDRFTDSTRAYQGAGHGVANEVIDAVDRWATGSRQPDRTLVFDLPVELARERSGKRSGAGKEADRLDLETVAFYERVRACYLELARAEPKRIRLIDAAGDVANTRLAVRDALIDLLPAVGGLSA